MNTTTPFLPIRIAREARMDASQELFDWIRKNAPPEIVELSDSIAILEAYQIAPELWSDDEDDKQGTMKAYFCCARWKDARDTERFEAMKDRI